jgi:hypothetical protein
VSFDERRDFTLEEQRKLDLSRLFADGLRDDDGKMRPELQGVASSAAAIQAEDEGVTADVLGRMVTAASENDLDESREHPEDLLEELEGAPRFAALVRSGLDACDDEDDYDVFVGFLTNVYTLARVRERSGRPPSA